MPNINCKFIQTGILKGTIAVFLLFISLSLNAKLVVTKLTCNYQQGLAVTEGDIRLGWQMVSETNADAQTAYQIRMYENVTGEPVYDSGKVESDQSQFISLPPLSQNKHGYCWQVRVWDAKGDASEWSQVQNVRVVPKELNAKWIGAISKVDARLPEGRWSNGMFGKDEFEEKWKDVDSLSSRSIILRKEFSTEDKQITDAVVYVCGLGHYEMCINGQKVGDSEFAPLWSEYDKTVYYNTYDVTPLLANGQNALSVLLGNGFFNAQRLGRYAKMQTSFGAPKLILRLEINYSDGSRTEIASDTDWKYSPSPITFNSIYGGESYDARLYQVGCEKAGFDDSGWLQAVEVEAPNGALVPQVAPPVKVMERYGIKSLNRVSSALVADMGQNLAGFPEIAVQGKAGQKITLVVAEKLDPEGTCSQGESGSPHYYEYTLGGEDIEVWHPRFSYYGFRYIQVEDAVFEGEPNPDDLPVIKDLQSCFTYSSAEEVSSFECSNPLFTKTHRLIERAERSNMQAILTDCPHREKLGWLEQDHLCGPSLLYNFDMTSYVPKIVRDMTDTQKPNGMMPTIAPQYVEFNSVFDDSPEWGSALLILPFMYYEQYGDNALITSNYEAMRSYVDYLTSRSENGIVSHGLGDWCDYGPWLGGFPRNTPIPLVATSHYIFDLQLLVKAAQMVDNQADVDAYSSLLHQVTDFFSREFYDPDSGTYGTGSQTSNALPLFLGITGENRQASLKSLVNDIQEHGNRLTTGDVGTRYLIQALAQNGCDELVYTMFNHDETPGYGYQLKFGATTLTEQWDPTKGNSLNHFMMGQIDEWLFKTVSGIQNQTGTAGLKHLLIKPTLVGDLEYVKASTESLYGRISVDCTTTSLSVEIPVGSDALIVLPDGTEKNVASGKYTFTSCER